MDCFRLKICGITRPEDAECCASAGADAIGLNFYAKSRRCIDVGLAGEIAAAAGNSVAKVGLFVNESPDRMSAIAEGVGLDWVQLHGDESAEFLTQLDPDLAVVWARRASEWSEVASDLRGCQHAGRMPDAVLVDAVVDGSYGGTGHTANWSALAQRGEEFATIPVLLAGGLTRENVAEAIRAVAPWGVDTASGVELSPGVKSAELVADFVSQAKSALGT